MNAVLYSTEENKNLIQIVCFFFISFCSLVRSVGRLVVRSLLVDYVEHSNYISLSALLSRLRPLLLLILLLLPVAKSECV